MDFVEADQMITWLCSLKEMDLNDLTYVLYSMIDGDHEKKEEEKEEKQNSLLMKLTTKVIKSTRVCVGMVGSIEQMILHVLLERNEYARVLVEMMMSMREKGKEKEKEKEIDQMEQKRMSEHILPVLMKIITSSTFTAANEREEGENRMDDYRVQLFHMLTGWLIGDWQALKQMVFQWLDWKWKQYEKNEEEGKMQVEGEQANERAWKQAERVRVAWIQEHLIEIQKQQQLEKEEEEGKGEEYVSCLQCILSISNQCLTSNGSDEKNQQLEQCNSTTTTTTTDDDDGFTELTILGQVLSQTISTANTMISKECISYILHYYFRYLQSEQSIVKVAAELLPIIRDIQQIVEKQGGKEEFQKWMDGHSFFTNMSEHSFIIYQEYVKVDGMVLIYL